MKKEKIEEFADNHYEMTINQATKLTLGNGEVLHGFIKRQPESNTSIKMKQDNKWHFVVLPNEHTPPKPTIIYGDEIQDLEIVEVSPLELVSK